MGQPTFTTRILAFAGIDTTTAYVKLFVADKSFATFAAIVSSTWTDGRKPLQEGGTAVAMTESSGTPLPIRDADQKDILELYKKFRRSKAKLVGPDGQTHSLPGSLYDFLVELISHLVAGHSVSIIQSQAQLTTVEAANMLGVSRAFLIKLLDRGEIPHHMVGTHRRIYVRDLLAYKTKRDEGRRQALRELARKELGEGLYDLKPPHAESD